MDVKLIDNNNDYKVIKQKRLLLSSFEQVKIVTVLVLLIMFLIADFYAFNNINLYFLFGPFYIISLYIFRGLDETNNISLNQFYSSFLIAALTSFIAFFALLGLFQFPISILLTIYYSIIALALGPLIVYFIYHFAIRRLPEIRCLVIADEIWGNIINEISNNSLRRFKIVAFINKAEEKTWLQSNNIHQIDLCISSYGVESLNFEDQSSGYESLGVKMVRLSNFVENHFKKIPMKLLESNTIFYNIVFSEKNGIPIIIRFMDICVSLLIMLILLPFFILSILLIFIFDGYPFFYYQIRPGFKGRPFYIYKLRTYKEINGKIISTRSGKILRQLRFNELPQIWNVLKGDMSLVGPRPDLPIDYEICCKAIDFYRYRYNVPPGITGHAQIYFKYVNSNDVESFAQRLEYDLYYIKNRSISLYITTLLRTVESVIFLRGY